MLLEIGEEKTIITRAKWLSYIQKQHFMLIKNRFYVAAVSAFWQKNTFLNFLTAIGRLIGINKNDY